MNKEELQTLITAFTIINSSITNIKDYATAKRLIEWSAEMQYEIVEDAAGTKRLVNTLTYEKESNVDLMRQMRKEKGLANE